MELDSAHVEFSFAVGHEIDHVDEIDQAEIKSVFEHFHKKYGEYLHEQKIKVYIKKHREKTHQTNLYFVRVSVEAPGHSFRAKAEGYGMATATRHALAKLEKQIEKKRGRK
jgi:ribosome-associated translation inhibitor RaiA